MKRYEDFDLQPYLDICADQGLAVCPYSPLAGGLLTGKYGRDGDWPEGSRAALPTDDFNRKYISGTARSVHDAICDVANEIGARPAQVARRWLIQQGDFERSFISSVPGRKPGSRRTPARARSS